MSTVARPKQAHPTNADPGGKGVLDYLRPFMTTTVGSKFLVALTGLALTGFVIGHLVGNLKIFGGPDAINSYAQFLKDLGPLLWVVRFGLLAVFVTHVLLVLKLKKRSADARPIGYAYPATVQASAPSRYMLLTGLLILTFLLFHLAHFTFGWIENVDYHDSKGRHDVYTMVVKGFSNPLIVGLYVVSQVVLFFHLIHGFQSAFQTLGANSPRFQRLFRQIGLVIATFLLLGNVGIPVYILAGGIVLP